MRKPQLNSQPRPGPAQSKLICAFSAFARRSGEPSAACFIAFPPLLITVPLPPDAHLLGRPDKKKEIEEAQKAGWSPKAKMGYAERASLLSNPKEFSAWGVVYWWLSLRSFLNGEYLLDEWCARARGRPAVRYAPHPSIASGVASAAACFTGWDWRVST